jgi:hypothetical protein
MLALRSLIQGATAVSMKIRMGLYVSVAAICLTGVWWSGGYWHRQRVTDACRWSARPEQYVSREAFEYWKEYHAQECRDAIADR